MSKATQYTSEPLTTRGARRLLKLAAFLRDMPRAKFNFAVIMNVGEKQPMEALAAGNHRCGTVGCAVGWMPAVWPKALKWDSYAMPRLIDKPRVQGFSAAKQFFDITHEDALWLFQPGAIATDANITTYYSGLMGDSSPKTVARHISKFVKHNYHGKAKLDFGA